MIFCDVMVLKWTGTPPQVEPSSTGQPRAAVPTHAASLV